MPILSRQLHLLGILLLVNMVLAVRYKFSIQEINIGNVRGFEDDDLFLAIACTTGPTTSNNSWPIGLVKDNSTIKWDNLTQEVDVPSSASNLSVAYGAINGANQDDGSLSSKPVRFPHN